MFVCFVLRKRMKAHSSTPNSAVKVTPMTSFPGWTMLLKGVSGVPGDLAQLWSSNNTMNPSNPAARTLTDDFKGYYKPDVANAWDQCQFEQVKVSVFKDGLEVGNIVFDTRGVDKNSWFQPNRIVSSTWNDIKTAPPGTFTIAKSPLTGREFSVSPTAGCDGQGWLFVSTTNSCSFESSKGPAPRFFFSLGPSVADLAKDKLGEADVLAIFGKGGNCNGGVLPPTSQKTILTACTYKGQSYGQGAKWSDGCDLDCSCVNASTGRYICAEKCPTYQNLSPQCQLKNVSGGCCLEPVCGGLVLQNKCYYKGSSYSEGAQWSDGCDFDCVCLNATTGDFKCKNICPPWNLPPECTLQDPAPGMCCQTPKCPYTWVPPPGYVPR
ncbi:uncharacterized protein LOC118477541 [Aplysia californica]|uniref:Uncharacterized protein LOC118477541 n=1 Tax=Aplysia californica TaxID=6500 RepID=A0ABM1VRW6_APLCA|nr:uncharacterized protein LOC118477541 [Aplysia californica]